MAGDVYTASPWVGRGGWSWYTGAAAWLHRAAIESMFGMALEARALSFAPALPPHWPRAELTLRRDGRTLHFLLLQATPEQALAMAAPWRQAQVPRLLLPGEQLDWTTERFDASFVVPLWPARAAAAAVSPAPMALARPTPAAALPTVPSEASV
jgi:cyclic beta-1,2-glucan synthetase